MKCKSEINTIEHLKEENLIGVNNNVLDKNRLLIKITELADHAKVKYGILKKVPFNIVRGIVIPDHTFFNAIDEFNEASQRRESDDPFVNAPIQETTPFEMDESTLTPEELQKLYRKEAEDQVYETEKQLEEAHKVRYQGVTNKLQKKLDETVLKLRDFLVRVTNEEKNEAFSGQAAVALNIMGKEVMQTSTSRIARSLDKIEAANYIKAIDAFYTFLGNQTSVLINQYDKMATTKYLTEFKKLSIYTTGEAYLKAFGEIKHISQLLTELENDTTGANLITSEEYKELKEKYGQIESQMDEYRTKLKTLRDNLLVEKYGNTKFFKTVQIKYQADAERRARAKKGLSKDDREAEVRKFMLDNRALIEDETKEAFRELITNPTYDITNVTSGILSDANTSNPYIQLAYKLIAESEVNYKNKVLGRLLHLNMLQNGSKTLISNDSKLVGNPAFYLNKAYTQQDYVDALNNGLHLNKKNFANMTEKDHLGVTYLKGEVKAEYRSRMLELNNNVRIATTDTRKENAIKALQKWTKENTEPGIKKNSIRPIAKWRNDLSTLTMGEAIMRDEFIKDTLRNNDKFNKKMSLVKGVAGLAKRHDSYAFYLVPKQLETNYSKFMRGDVLGGIKKTYQSITQKEIDDVAEGLSVQRELDEKGKVKYVKRTLQDLGGKELNSLNINYRSEVLENQNMDLLSVYAKEIENAEKYQANKDIEEMALMLANNAGDNQFFKTKGFRKILGMAVGKDQVLGDFDKIEGENSQVYKKLMNMIENNVYEVTSKYEGKIFGIDANRGVGSFIAYSSYLGMALKIPGAVNNFFVGNIANFIEQVGGEFTNLKDTRKAHAFYSKNFGGIVKDIGRPVKTNVVNQLMSLFDTGGDYSQLNNQYERDNRAKQLAESSTLFGLYSSGEHIMQGTLFLSILQGTKVLNKQGKYINKEGKVVKGKSEAASLLDMYELNEDGVLAIKKNSQKQNLFTYTSVDLLNKYEDGGELSIKTLVKDRIFRAHGIYDVKRQSSFQRNFYGKLFLHYKKFFESAFLNRFRGTANVHRKTSDLRDHEKYYNFATGTEEYGYHVSFLREVIATAQRVRLEGLGAIANAKNENRALSNHEVANIRKSVTEIVTTMSMLTLAFVFAAAAQDDDDELLWMAAYFARRQQNELMQFYAPGEMIRMANSPVASMKQLQGLTGLFASAINPFTYGEKYLTGDNAGRYKNMVRLQRSLFPKSEALGYDVDYKKMYHFFDSMN